MLVGFSNKKNLSNIQKSIAIPGKALQPVFTQLGSQIE